MFSCMETVRDINTITFAQQQAAKYNFHLRCRFWWPSLADHPTCALKLIPCLIPRSYNFRLYLRSLILFEYLSCLYLVEYEHFSLFDKYLSLWRWSATMTFHEKIISQSRWFFIDRLIRKNPIQKNGKPFLAFCAHLLHLAKHHMFTSSCFSYSGCKSCVTVSDSEVKICRPFSNLTQVSCVHFCRPAYTATK